MTLDKEFEEFEKFEFETDLMIEVKPDKKRRKELSRLLTRMQYVFEVQDAEILNQIIKI